MKLSGLIERHQSSPAFRRMSPATIKTQSGVYQRLLAAFGDHEVSSITNEMVQRFIGSMASHPGRAANMLDRLRAMCRFGVNIGEIPFDPTTGVKRFPLGTFHTWTDDEIRSFQCRFSATSAAMFRYANPRWSMLFEIEERWVRLTFDLFIYLGQRRADITTLSWSQIGHDSVFVRQQKTGRELWIPIAPPLAETLARFPRGNGSVLINAHGNAFTPDQLSNVMGAAIKSAGLPKHCTPHGLRKAMCRRLAEAGCTANEIQAISGHSTLKEVSRYTAAVDQKLMASRAMDKLHVSLAGIPASLPGTNPPDRA